ncbi:MAG: Smr/MutS family protein [Gammaproteobacteria bacterium]|nr:Smr/MutS family protein [Gammaproteobacteria bacterium]
MTSSKSNDADFELFRATVGSVKQIKNNRVIHRTTRPKPLPRQRLNDEQQVLEDMFATVDSDQTEAQANVDTEDSLSYSRTGIQHGIMRKLRRGQYAIEAELDMHGMTVAIAKPILAEFLYRAQTMGKRCVKIIHGKGYRSTNQQPVLKTRINNWLRRSNTVVAFHSAKQRDGGTGAVYVLIKQKR